MKTGLEAAKHYFKEGITEARRQRDQHGWNQDHGLYFLAESLQRIERRLTEIEKRLDALEKPGPG